MSTVMTPTATATGGSGSSGRPPRLLRAELLRSRGTFTWGSLAVSLAVAVYCLVLAQVTLSSGLSVDGGQWDGNILAWLSFYPVAVALPAGALTGAMAEWREQRWRYGGTAWRPVPAARATLARAGVLTLAALAAQVVLLAPVVAHGLLMGQGPGPAGRYLPFGLLMWVGTAGAALLGALACRLLGGAAVGLAPAAALAWSVAGALGAESPGWLLRPWTWLVRGTLPLLGVHANSVSLEPGSPVWHWPWWPSAALLTGALAAALVLLMAVPERPVVAGGRGRRRRPGRAGEAQPRREARGAGGVDVTTRVPETAGVPAASGLVISGPARAAGRPRPLRALLLVLPWGVWSLLAVLMVALTALVSAVYGPGAALSLLGLVGLPVSASVAGTTAWSAQSSARRGLLLRERAGVLDAAALGLTTVFLSAVATASWAAAGGSAAAASGLAPTHMLLVTPWVLLVTTAAAYAVTQLAGLATALVVAVLGLLTSLVIAGNEALSAALWPAAPWGWAHVVATAPATWPAVMGLSALLGAALCGRPGRP
ncbi:MULTISPECIES: hypothetical protein [unclassified Actinomyces]|uniref:hypothetical protein n=1 Tax=unclassified Actinomyces TaxID=2609248 RepID=UPI002016C5FA|nr:MULTISPECIES: hypothetical protein [unclassified Actinomyces]MCL3776704.1 hypothetical protein [Actinomyces sp. AC-20-1]MCL3790541.1 hypothetical protein [Actinomyces sp. 187325]MCL3792837.1 hypothetical protein [Actinomyces sp. 186855]MCL3795307.1 hypothetical protein [Actinomyces sp. 217892]